jgi:8-oxo-dGTP diphosphatase
VVRIEGGLVPSRTVAFTPKVGTLGYILDRATDQVLMIRRNARPDDDHFGKMNGLGGKVEPDEAIVESLRRELAEEANIDVVGVQLRGTITWSNFGPNEEAWLGFVFLIDAWTGSIPQENTEGSLEWVPLDRLLAACDADPEIRASAELPMWAGDRHFLPLVFDDDPRVFHGTMPYDRDRPLAWTYERI